MDARCAGLLTQPGNGAFDFLALVQDQIAEFVHHDDDIGQKRELFPFARAGVVHFPNLAVVVVQLAHAEQVEQGITPFHFIHGPHQGIARQLRHHRVHQMGKIVVDLKFHDLGVDKQQLHFVGPRLVQQAEQNGVQAYAFACPGGPGQQ